MHPLDDQTLGCDGLRWASVGPVLCSTTWRVSGALPCSTVWSLWTDCALQSVSCFDS